jgi:hypothetical protein
MQHDQLLDSVDGDVNCSELKNTYLDLSQMYVNFWGGD